MTKKKRAASTPWVSIDLSLCKGGSFMAEAKLPSIIKQLVRTLNAYDELLPAAKALIKLDLFDVFQTEGEGSPKVWKSLDLNRALEDLKNAIDHADGKQ